MAAASRDTIKKRIYNVIVVGLGGCAAFLFGYVGIGIVTTIVAFFLLFGGRSSNRWLNEVIFAIPVIGGIVVGVAFMVFHVRRSSRKPPPPSAPQG